MFSKISRSLFLRDSLSCDKISIFVKTVEKYMYMLPCMYKYTILKRIIAKYQNLVNMQKITNWCATNAISFT